HKLRILETFVAEALAPVVVKHRLDLELHLAAVATGADEPALAVLLRGLRLVDVAGGDALLLAILQLGNDILISHTGDGVGGVEFRFLVEIDRHGKRVATRQRVPPGRGVDQFWRRASRMRKYATARPLVRASRFL